MILTLASSPMRIRAVMIASRTRGTVSAARAAASTGTAPERPARARAAAHLLSASALPRAASCSATSAPAPPAPGPLLLPLTRGIGAHQIDDCGGNVVERPYHFGTAILHQFAGHAPNNRGRLCLRDCPSPPLAESLHRLGAVIAHAGHQDANEPIGIELYKRAADQTFHTRVPWVAGVRRHWHRA